MKRTAKILLSTMLVLMFVFSFAGAMPAAWADYNNDGGIETAFYLWQDKTDTEEAGYRLYDDAEHPITADFGKDEDNRPISTIRSLKENGVSVTIPEDLYVESVTLSAKDETDSEHVLNLNKYAVLSGQSLIIPASAFADEADGSNILDVLSSGQVYVFSVSFHQIDDVAEVEVTYTGGELKDELGQLFADGDKFTVDADGHQVKAIPVEKENDAVQKHTKGFTGWKLVYENGISTEVSVDSVIHPYADAELVAQWEDIIVVIASQDGDKVYDGTAHKATVKVNGVPVSDESNKATVTLNERSVTVEITDYDTDNSSITNYVKEGKVYTPEVSATYEDNTPVDSSKIRIFPVTLFVEKAPILLESSSLTVEYDGQPHTAKDVTITGRTFGTDKLTAIATGSIINIDRTTNTISYTFTGNEGNYEVRLKQGTLRVTKRSLTVTVDDCTKPYDGTALTASNAKITKGSLLEGHEISYTFSGSQTVPNTSDSSVTATVKSGDDNVTEFYDITVIPGKLTVTPLSGESRIPLTIAPKDATAEYDGTAHGASDYQIVSGKLPEGVTITVTYGNERTDAGEGETSIGLVTFLQDGADVSENFNVTANTGKITISQRPITITADSATNEYDSKALTKNTYTVSENSLLSNHNVTAIEIVGSQTEVGTSKNTIKENSVKITDGEGNDVTKNYAITLKDGTLEVTKRPITITAESATKEFDGKPLTQNTAKVTSGSLLTGHKVSSIVIEGSQTEVGKARNIIKSGSVKIVDAQNNDVTKNYAITLAEGILEVTGKTVTDITVTVNESKVYDGTALTLTADKIKVNPALPSGYTISATFSTSSRTDAGSDEITLTNIAIKDASGNNVTSKYNIKVEKGKLEVTKRPLTVTTADKTKVYDGKELTDRTVPTIEGQLSQHNIELKFTGTQTKVGSSDNSVQILSIKDKETKADVTANYEITYKFGKLTVTSSTGGSGSGSNSGSNSKPTVNTGDTNNIWIWILLMVAAAGAAVAVVIFVRKSKKNGDDPTDPTGNDQNK